tara:strand:+ start:162 stop:686 length:525 start_codon:yes stop_codon:yes gene_type:complete
MNHVCVIDNSLSSEECDDLINEMSQKLIGPVKAPWNYHHHDITYPNKIILKLVGKIIPQYKKENPDVNLTMDPWSLENFKFIQFKPGNYYDAFHSEQSYTQPRVFAVLVYLSDHNCGTEFTNGKIVKSVKGRSLIFPAYWTHTHKGQPCPDNKIRYILSTHAKFNKRDKHELES